MTPLSTILASLAPGLHIPDSPHADPGDRQPCPWCGQTVWRLAARHAGSKESDPGTPILLNLHPDPLGRWEIVGPGEAVFCSGIRLSEWPLPRYASHLVVCAALAVERGRQREERAEQMRWGKQARAEERKRFVERRDAAYRRIDRMAGVGEKS